MIRPKGGCRCADRAVPASENCRLQRVTSGKVLWMYLERMSGDEFMILIVSAATAAGAWYQWYRIALIRTLVDRNVSRPLLLAAPVFCMMLLYVVLRSWAADDVRSSGIYMTFYMLGAPGFWLPP